MSMGDSSDIDITSGCVGAVIKGNENQKVKVEATLSGLQSIYILLIIICVYGELKHKILYPVDFYTFTLSSKNVRDRHFDQVRTCITGRAVEELKTMEAAEAVSDILASQSLNIFPAVTD